MISWANKNNVFPTLEIYDKELILNEKKIINNSLSLFICILFLTNIRLLELFSKTYS